MTRYSVWINDAESMVSLVAGDKPPKTVNGSPVPGYDHVLHVIDAESWDDAQRQYHALMGWKPYRSGGRP